MPALDSLPAEPRSLLDELVAAIAPLPGVVALALGGSHARGTAAPDSDVDVGLYYRESEPPSLDDVRRVAADLHVGRSRPVVTDFYEWGPWVNGGAWLETRAGRFDLLYRNLDQVSRVIDGAREGRTESHYEQQPTYGFHSVIYLGETNICVPLHDPEGILAELKARVEDYPPALKRTIVQKSLWSAEFTLSFARKVASRADPYNTVGCLARALSLLTQALFALNETYFLGDKGALEAIEGFRLKPEGYGAVVSRVLGQAGSAAEDLAASVREVSDLWRGVIALAPEYEPKYPLLDG